MARSLKVVSENLEKAKTGLLRSGLPRQQDLADELEISRDTVNKFFNGRPIAVLNFQEICKRLSLEWQEMAGIQAPIPGAKDKTQFAKNLSDWFKVLNYKAESELLDEKNSFEWIIQVPIPRRGFDRVLVRGVSEDAGIGDVYALWRSVRIHKAEEGWLVAQQRVSEAARSEINKKEYEKKLLCYNFDELIDTEIDFTNYFEWLEKDVQEREIVERYIPLECTKAEVEEKSKKTLAISDHSDEKGGLERYVDSWMEYDIKEHLSILGEFGTGKSWFTMHYAWKLLQKYQVAKESGLPRPRIPLVIQLRDFAKTTNVGNVLANFFFSKHNIRLSNEVFAQLNRMGKLLLIFDGFDEMADRMNKQKMANNFWELAKVIESGAKAILTCRTEHFEDAIQSRRALSMELLASTQKLTGEPPQFEIVELKLFNEKQIRKALERKTKNQEAIEKIFQNPQLLDLAKRPIMTDLILEALPEIEANKPIDLSRVYLYAVRQKMERDINIERTFTSLADKLYFLCELAWEMLSSEEMSMHYSVFQNTMIPRLFPQVQEQKDLDHWHYDMIGQTLLCRDEEGNYSFAHRSLQEFFVAYKLAAELGVLHPDFLAVAQAQLNIDTSAEPKEYRWSEYFCRRLDSKKELEKIPQLLNFTPEPFEHLCKTLGEKLLAKAVLDLMHPILDLRRDKREKTAEYLVSAITGTKGKEISEVGYIAGNAVNLTIPAKRSSLQSLDLSGSVIQGADFRQAIAMQTDFTNATLEDCTFATFLSGVNSVVFSPDGESIVTGEESGLVRLWRSKNFQEVLRFVGHQDSVTSVSFSPDGKCLASGSDDATVKLWNTSSSECLQTLQGHQSNVDSVSFSPDGKCLASGSDDATVKLWNLSNGECLQTLQGHQSNVDSVSFSPDGKCLASGSDDATVKLWNLSSGECLQTLQGHQSNVDSVSFSPDGKCLASGSRDSTVKLWNLSNGECLQTLQGHQFYVTSVSFSPDGKCLASGSDDATVKLWNLSNGECLQTLLGHQDFVTSVSFSPDGKCLASGSRDSTVKLWNLSNGECLQTLSGHRSNVDSVSFSPDGKCLASGSWDSTVKLWNLSSGECLQTLSGHQSNVDSVSFSPDGKCLASGSWDSTVKLWNLSSGECLQTLQGHQSHVDSVSFSPDGKCLASGSRDSTVKLWNLSNGECLQTLLGHQDFVDSVSFSPDGKCLASGSWDSTVKLWNLSNGECLQTLLGHQDFVTSVSFSPDGKCLASGSRDSTVKLWNLSNGECLQTLSGHRSHVYSVSFSPDGKCLASGSWDSTVKLWNLSSGECLQTLSGHQSNVDSVSFSPDGKCLASGSWDSTVKLWNLSSGECLQTFSNLPYHRMSITNAKGLMESQKESLLALGAINESR